MVPQTAKPVPLLRTYPAVSTGAPAKAGAHACVSSELDPAPTPTRGSRGRQMRYVPTVECLATEGNDLLTPARMRINLEDLRLSQTGQTQKAAQYPPLFIWNVRDR